MQQPPPNYYGNPYPPTYPQQNNNQNYQQDNDAPPPPQGYKTIDNDTFTIDFENLPKERITVYATFPDSAVWHDRVFKGILIEASNEYVTLFDEETKTFTTIVGVYVNFVEFKDKTILTKNRN